MPKGLSPVDYLSERAAGLTPYQAGEQPKDAKYIKLNTNENPYPPSPKIAAAVHEAAEHLPLYPDPDASGLVRAIAKTEGIGEDCVFCGNGSDEVLSFTFGAFFGGEKPLLFPDITYSFYPVFAKFYDIKTEIIPLNSRFEISVDDYLKPASGVIFPNPNAPTGIFLDPAEIRRLLEYHKDCAVVIDEAYIAFGGQSVVPMIREYPNLLVIRTLSKSHALAGMRVGYALGQPGLIDGLQRVKNSFNSYPVDRLAAAAAEAAVLDTEYYADIDGRVVRTRERFAKELRDLDFTVLPSGSNFVFASPAGRADAKTLFEKLKERGVLVRYFSQPRIDQFLRISIGTDEAMEKVVRILKELLG